MNFLKVFPVVFLFMAQEKSCSKDVEYEKGFAIESVEAEAENQEGVQLKASGFDTKPSSVVLTGLKNLRLSTIYKVNYNLKDSTTFIGENYEHYDYYEEYSKGNNWNGNFMPGISALYGFNLVNISLFNFETQKAKNLFDKHVLIKTLYYPSNSQDTLDYKLISRDFFMISVYNEDTNKDGFVNLKDLRRLYWFDNQGERIAPLVPENYSVLKSEYDEKNDYMYVFAMLDEDGNGARNEGEATHIFWIDLKNPALRGRVY